MSRYLVTGAAGFLGNVLVRRLVEAGASVVAVVAPGEPSPSLDGVDCLRVEADVRDAAALETRLGPHLAGADTIVVHAAGIVSIAERVDPQMEAVNVGGTTNMIALCERAGVRRLVYVSSVHAIPTPPAGIPIVEVDRFDPDQVVGGYAKTKARATALVLAAARRGLDAVVVHPSGIIGPGDFGHTHFTQLVLDVLDGRLGAYVAGGYDFVDVRDVADGILAAATRGRRGATYILSGRFVPLGELFPLLERLSGTRTIRTVLPMGFAKATAGLSELYYRTLGQPPLYTRYSLHTVRSNALFRHDRASRELGYTPRPLETTLGDMIAWLRAHDRERPATRRARDRRRADPPPPPSHRADPD